MHLSPTETILVMRLLTPTQASLARSRSAFMLSKQASDSGKRGQTGNPEENAKSDVGLPLSYSGISVFCFPFSGFVKCLQRLITFSIHQSFAIAVFLLSVRKVSYFIIEVM